jgi:hypothetical protein
MRYFRLAAIAAMVVPLAARASDMVPGQGVEHIFGATSVLTYYVATTEGFHLVATMNNLSGDPATVIRVSTMLTDGQQVVMSMPRPIGEKSKEVIFQRDGDRLMVTEPEELVARGPN